MWSRVSQVLLVPCVNWMVTFCLSTPFRTFCVLQPSLKREHPGGRGCDELTAFVTMYIPANMTVQEASTRLTTSRTLSWLVQHIYFAKEQTENLMQSLTASERGSSEAPLSAQDRQTHGPSRPVRRPHRALSPHC